MSLLDAMKSRAPSQSDPLPKTDSSDDKSHGSEQDSQQEAHRAAGQDLIDAIQGGDALEVFAAHKHLSDVHSTAHEPDGDSGKSNVVSALKSMSMGKKKE